MTSRLKLSSAELVGLFVIGAAGGLMGDEGHVASGTTRYLATGVPYIWKSQLWFPLLVGGATAALAELRLHLDAPRAEGGAAEATAAIAAVIGLYAVTALVRHSPLGPATAIVYALAAIIAVRFAGGAAALACALLATLFGCVTEIVMSAAGVFEYAPGIDGLAGVAPWLPGLYFAFGVVAARLGELCLARRAPAAAA